MGSNNRELLPKIFIAVLLIAALVVFLYSFFNNTGAGLNLNLYYGHGTNFNALIVSTLVLAVKMLWLVFIISLGIGLLLIMKKYLFEERKDYVRYTGKTEGSYSCPCCGTTLTVDFKFCPKCKASLNDICNRCGKELQVGWKSCPWCGTARKM